MFYKRVFIRTLTILLFLAISLTACDFRPHETAHLTGDNLTGDDLDPSGSNDASNSLDPTTDSTSNTSTSPIETSEPTPDINSPQFQTDVQEVIVPPEASISVADASGLWQRWPSNLTTPVQLNMDLTVYKGLAKSESALDGIIVILDPGHGGKDPGAIANLNGQSILEKDINLPIAEMTKAELEALGATVVMTRENDDWVSLYSRVAIAGFETLKFWDKELSAAGLSQDWLMAVKPELDRLVSINEDTVESGGRGIAQGMGVLPELRLLLDAQVQTDHILFLSIHANSTDVDVANKRGLQIYIATNQVIYDSELQMISQDATDPEVLPINPNYTAYDDGARMKLANALFSSITTNLPELRQSDISAFAGNFAFLRELNLTSALIETGFMSHPDDLALLTDPLKQAEIAAGIADGVWRYFSQ